jgi:hypothetical protein
MWDYDTYDCDFNTHKSDSYTQSVIFTRMSVILTLTSVITTRTSVITTRTSVTLTRTNENYVRLLREIRDYVVFTSRTWCWLLRVIMSPWVWFWHSACDFNNNACDLNTHDFDTLRIKLLYYNINLSFRHILAAVWKTITRMRVRSTHYAAL